MKYSLTNESISYIGATLFRIKAERSFGSVVKGELGGYIQKEDNLEQSGNAWVSGNARVYGNAQVYGDAQVYGNAWVSGNAQVSAKASFTKGWFIGGDDSKKITDITEKIGSNYWKAQYVLGNYKITPIEEETVSDDSVKEAIATLEKAGKLKDGKILI